MLLDQVVTRRDVAVYVRQFVSHHTAYTGTLDEYLRGVMAALSTHKHEKPTFRLHTRLLTDAFSVAPLSFDPAWLAFTASPVAVTALDGADMPHTSEVVMDLLRYQVSDLWRMAEAGMLDNPQRYMGLQSPTGNSWYNFDPASFLMCAFSGIVDNVSSG